MANREITYREAINEALRLEMERDADVIVIGEDVAGGAGLPPDMQDAFGGVFGVTKGLLGKFGPRRFRRRAT
jgi:pyruvate/2-oxoglutarate/acetoin dehydrogenase E1 component